MRKETDIAIRLAFIMGIATSCTPMGDLNRGQTPTTEPSPTNTLSVDTPSFEPTQSFTEISTTTPTPESPFIRKEIDLGIPGKLSLSMTDPLKYYSFGEIVVYPDESKDGTKEEQQAWLNENFHPGDGTIVSETDNLDNLILFIHDGYMKKGTVMLEAEPLRKYIEGYKEKTINDPNYIKITMQSLVGTTINLSKDEKTSDFEIKAIVQIPKDQVDFYDSNTETIFENAYTISQNTNKTDGATEVIEKYVKNGGGFAISICGWGFNGKDLMTSQTRYVIFLEPIQE